MALIIARLSFQNFELPLPTRQLTFLCQCMHAMTHVHDFQSYLIMIAIFCQRLHGMAYAKACTTNAHKLLLKLWNACRQCLQCGYVGVHHAGGSSLEPQLSCVNVLHDYAQADRHIVRKAEHAKRERCIGWIYTKGANLQGLVCSESVSWCLNGVRPHAKLRPLSILQLKLPSFEDPALWWMVPTFFWPCLQCGNQPVYTGAAEMEGRQAKL